MNNLNTSLVRCSAGCVNQKPYLESCVKKKYATTPSGPLSRRTQISVRNAGTYSSASIGTALDGSI